MFTFLRNRHQLSIRPTALSTNAVATSTIVLDCISVNDSHLVSLHSSSSGHQQFISVRTKMNKEVSVFKAGIYVQPVVVTVKGQRKTGTVWSI